MLFWGEDNDNGTSEGEEDELEHHPQIKLSVTRASTCSIFLGHLNLG